MNKIPHVFLAGMLSLLLAGCNSNGPAYKIEPPFKSIAPVYDTFTLDASESKMLHIPGGSSIEIPENAFVDKYGNVVKGKVALKYREFNTAAEILTSGIPMLSNDEEGNTKPFESGGMFEIGATANGEEVHIAKDKKINVHLASKVDGDFDFYYLEEEGSKKTETAALFLQTQPTAAAASDKQYRWKKIYSVADDTTKNSSAERKKNPNAKYFQAHFDTQKYPETAALDTIKWEYAGIAKTDDPIDPSNAFFQKTNWTKMFVTQPEYYTELVRKINLTPFSKFRHSGQMHMLPDTLGFLAEDGEDYVSHYGWNGSLKKRFQGVIHLVPEYSAHMSANFINKQRTHILLSDKENHCKLFLLNGTLVKDLGFLSMPFFDSSGNKIIGSLYNDRGEHWAAFFSLEGTLIQKIAIEQTYYSWYSEFVADDYSKFTVFRNGKICILDVDGKELAALKIKDQSGWYFTHNNEVIVIYTYEEQDDLIVWDWKKNKVSKIEASSDFYGGYNEVHPTDPLMILCKEKADYVWNWEKNSYKEINARSKGLYVSFSPKGDFIYPFHYGERTLVTGTLYRKDGTAVVTLPASVNYSFNFNEDESKILVAADTTKLFVIDKTGKTIIDLKKYDSQIGYAFFNKNEELISIAKGGVVMFWDQNGKLLKTIQTNITNSAFMPLSNSLVCSYNSKQPMQVWDLKANKMLYAYSDLFAYDSDPYAKSGRDIKMTNNAAISWSSDPNEISILWKKTTKKLPSGVYRLSFKKDSLELHTYVYMNAQQLALVKEYQRAVQGRINQESKRVVEEEKLIRSFSINKFGIYNWDRFYKDSNAVLAKATVELGNSATDFNNITFFLITGKDRNVVVKYYSNTLDKFAFVPEDNNLLLAVLPDERIAVFDEKEFRALNVEEIKKQGNYTFKMKILEGQASKAVLDRVLQKPS